MLPQPDAAVIKRKLELDSRLSCIYTAREKYLIVLFWSESLLSHWVNAI